MMHVFLIKVVFAIFYTFLLWLIYKADLGKLILWKKIILVISGIPGLLIILILLKLLLKDEIVILDLWMLGGMIYIIQVLLVFFYSSMVSTNMKLSIEAGRRAFMIFRTLKFFLCLIALILTLLLIFFIRN